MYHRSWKIVEIETQPQTLRELNPAAIFNLSMAALLTVKPMLTPSLSVQ